MQIGLGVTHIKDNRTHYLADKLNADKVGGPDADWVRG